MFRTLGNSDFAFVSIFDIRYSDLKSSVIGTAHLVELPAARCLLPACCRLLPAEPGAILQNIIDQKTVRYPQDSASVASALGAVSHHDDGCSLLV
jgi:hypothetical protein